MSALQPAGERASRGSGVKRAASDTQAGGRAVLRERFGEALARFPADLPYEIEEHRNNTTVQKYLKEQAEQWAGFGDADNYRKQKAGPDRLLISYESPKPLSSEQEKRLVQKPPP